MYPLPKPAAKERKKRKSFFLSTFSAEKVFTLHKNTALGERASQENPPSLERKKNGQSSFNRKKKNLLNPRKGERWKSHVPPEKKKTCHQPASVPTKKKKKRKATALIPSANKKKKACWRLPRERER